jgi:hypothetical protein
MAADTPDVTPSNVEPVDPEATSSVMPGTKAVKEGYEDPFTHGEDDDVAMAGLGNGPSIRIHRHGTFFLISHDGVVVATRILQCMVVIWLVGGFVLISCVSLSVIVNISYRTFNTAGVSFAVASAFLFYTYFVLKLCGSLMRTTIRLIIQTWRRTFGGKKCRWFLMKYRRARAGCGALDRSDGAACN